jgi:uncharacterized protein YukE
MKFAMGAQVLTNLTKQTSGASGDLGTLVRKLADSAEPLQGRFNGAGRAAFDRFKAETDTIANELNGRPGHGAVHELARGQLQLRRGPLQRSRLTDLRGEGGNTMSGGNQADRRDYDVAASQNAQDNFNAVAAQLEALIAQRDSDVKAAMADYQADGVSDEYHAKEQRWNAVAGEVKQIIATLRSSLQSNDESAQSAISKAKSAVGNIG